MPALHVQVTLLIRTHGPGRSPSYLVAQSAAQFVSSFAQYFITLQVLFPNKSRI
jgi:hypothetical protein